MAALTVVVDHAATVFYLPGMPRWGHHAAVIFFVLSGYVICHAADTRETSLRTFLVARFARLWSVLVPATALLLLCDLAGSLFADNPATHALVPIEFPVLRTDGVIWSLRAEFWYYMLFAAWVFVPRGRTRAVAVSGAALLAGPGALLLLPVWLLGVALQRSRRLRRLSPRANAVLWLGGAGVVGLVLTTPAYDAPIAITQRLLGSWIVAQFAQARGFWFDWVFGLAVAAHLLGARAVVARLPLERIGRPVRWCAGASFAAYLLHLPLLHFWAAFLPPDRGLLAIVLSLSVIALVGPPVERSKRWWRDQLNRALDYGVLLGGRFLGLPSFAGASPSRGRTGASSPLRAKELSDRAPDAAAPPMR